MSRFNLDAGPLVELYPRRPHFACAPTRDPRTLSLAGPICPFPGCKVPLTQRLFINRAQHVESHFPGDEEASTILQSRARALQTDGKSRRRGKGGSGPRLS